MGYLVVVTALLLLGTAVTHGLSGTWLGRWDVSSARWLSAHRVAWLDEVTHLLSQSADTLGVVVVSVGVSVVLALRRHWAQILVLVSGLALELSAFLLVNVVVARPRPDVVRLGSTPTTSSFPSGHSAAAVVVYVSIAIFVSCATRRLWPRALAWVVAVAMPVAVGFARVYRGMHHPLDVAGGLVLGSLVVPVAVVAISAGRAATLAEADELPTPPRQPVGALP